MKFNDVIEKHYNKVENIQSIEQLLRHSSYLFVNSHPLVDFARPVPEKVKFIGGIADEQQHTSKNDRTQISEV